MHCALSARTDCSKALLAAAQSFTCGLSTRAHCSKAFACSKELWQALADHSDLLRCSVGPWPQEYRPGHEDLQGMRWPIETDDGWDNPEEVAWGCG